MNSRNLVALLVALAVLVALALAVSVSQKQAPASGGLLLPDLKGQLNDVDRIVVRAGGNKTIATLERRPEGWVVADHDAYPADVGRIRKNLIALAEATILEEKTSNPELYDRLKVDDIEKDTAGGLRLDIGAGQATTGVIIGSTGVGGGERAYVRRAGEPTSWLVSGAFEAPREPGEWLDRTLTNVSGKRVQSVAITHPDGTVLRLAKETPEAPDFTVLDVPAGRQLAFPAVGNAIGAGLYDLTFDAVEPAAGFAPGDVKPAVARFATFDGLVVEVSAWKLPAGPRLRFAASADQAQADRYAPKAPAATDAKAAADAAAAATAAEPRKTFEEVKAEAAQINARLGNWVYTAPEFKSEQFTKKLDDLLQPKAPAKK